MIWRTITEQRKARDRARIKVERVSTKLIHYTGAIHTLRGLGGMRTLAEVCEAWNQSGFDQPDPTRCRADFATEAARKTFTLSITR